MRKVVLSLMLLISASWLYAQEVDREMVVLEIGTSVNCTFCPGAALGADDLLANGQDVAVLEHHTSTYGPDPYSNQYADSRVSYYGMNSWPTSKFDGVVTYVGGNHSSSIYTQYLPRYNQRKAIPSHIAMNMVVSNAGLDYTAVVTMTKVGNLTASNLKLYFFVSQSHISYAWQGQTHLNYVTRLMVPDQNGTGVDFSGGDVQTATLNFTMNAAWPLEDCEFIAYVQDNSTKEIQQAVKKGALPFIPEFNASETEVCRNAVITFNDATSGGYINVPYTYQWTFPGGIPATSTDASPMVGYPAPGNYDVILKVMQGVTQVDSIIKTGYIHVSPVINILASPAATVCENVTVTLDGTTANAASYQWTPGGATTPTLEVDSSGIGIGSKEFTLQVTTLNGCTSNSNITVTFEDCTGISDLTSSERLQVFPNPSNGNFSLVFKPGKPDNVSLKIMNVIGNMVFEENNIPVNGTLSRSLNLEDLSSGIYFLTLKCKDRTYTQKVYIK